MIRSVSARTARPTSRSSISLTLRAMPNMRVFRPADAVETAECWQLAIERREGPTVLALTRQALSQVRKHAGEGNLCARGGYEISPAEGEAKAGIFASGFGGRDRARGAEAPVRTRHDGARRLGALPRPPPRPAARTNPPRDRWRSAGQGRYRGGGPLRLDALIGSNGLFVGMKGFGASAPYEISTSTSASRRRPSPTRCCA